MPWLTRAFLRLALLYLLLGFTIGSLMLANKGLNISVQLLRLLPIHIEFLFFGWTLQMVLGVAFWTLPKYWVKPRRGSVTGAYLALILINGGIWLVAAGALWNLPAGFFVMGRVLEFAAVAAFSLSAWRRIVPRNVEL